MGCIQWFWAKDENGDDLPFDAIIKLWVKVGDGEYDFAGKYWIGVSGMYVAFPPGLVYKCEPIIPTDYAEEWSSPADFEFDTCSDALTIVYKRYKPLYLDEIGLDHWEGNKAFLKGAIRGIQESDEICVVFMYPGHSDHNAILSTTSSIQYIYFNGSSGDYDLAAASRYIPYVNQGTYAVRIIDVSGNCENWSRERDITGFTLIAEMTLIPVISSNLEAVGWLDSTLEIIFKSGWHYQYDGVPEEIFNGLMEAPSKGKYFWANIRCKCHACKECPIPYTYRRLN